MKCQANTVQGAPCSRNARKGHITCKQHMFAERGILAARKLVKEDPRFKWIYQPKRKF